ncbi:uncharacterized protein LOC122394343 [Amphibalanus amphitrite]|uniref:uncharacterized protein LOC122394343 n=1 Tax=Amphibalanus amphitrite TaxID=1232801 RepID=UPI001C90F8D5|nr:uncharacterized protein LOC122394343 [Amphibalanus amphitrite]
MSKILSEVLAQDSSVQSGTDHFMDDIIVQENIVTADQVAAHLQKYGLETKPPEALDGGRVLGLQLNRDSQEGLQFSRGNEIPVMDASVKLTRRKLFSICGRLTGHYPVCGWLRVACSYIKRRSEGVRWEDDVGMDVRLMTEELLEKVQEHDPVRGPWLVKNEAKHGRVWCDASSLAMGVALEINGAIVEDAAWLRKTTDYNHINIAELDAAVRGVNLSLKWGLQSVEVITDSVTVKRWLSSALEGNCRIKVAGMSELLVRRRLGLFKELVDSYSLLVTIQLVESKKNRADILTRVSKRWLGGEKDKDVCAANVELLHAEHHFGVDKTLYLGQLVDPELTRAEVEQCVQRCAPCQSIDPSPVTHEGGSLAVTDNWSRLAVDTTHFGNRCYITVVDCGPSRHAIWRRIRSENAEDVATVLEELFRERGPVDELLCDNSTTFRSYKLAELCRQWNIRQRFRAAYRPSGNGIVERNHRTIKRMAARGGITPLKAVFWYNLAAKDGSDPSTAPSRGIFTYRWRHPEAQPKDPALSEERMTHEYRVGDQVWVKPPGARCTTRWSTGQVTGVVSGNTVLVDGVPRHVLDVRRVTPEGGS